MIENKDDQSTLEGNDIVSDLYEMLASIDNQMHYGDTSENRTDYFKIGFENLFNVDIDKVDEIENLISERQNAGALISIYNEIKTGMRSMFDKYLGIKFNYDDINNSVDMQGLYSVYKVVCTDIMDCMAKVFAYMNKSNPHVYNLNRPDVWDDFLGNVEDFNLDSIPKILSVMDPGNMDYEYVFGEVPEIDSDVNVYLNKVSIDFDVFVKHFKMELRLGAGVINTGILLKKVNFYSDYITKNHII